MSYLKCEKCKSYYELQPGEKPEDFDLTCNCGGKLKYSETMDIVGSDWDEASISTICQKCGTKNSKKSIYCSRCGTDLDEETKIQSTNGVTDWWNQQTSGTRTAIGVIGVCCLGLILILGISGMFSPDKNAVSTTTQPVQPSTSTQSATPVQSATWHNIVSFTGTGDKDTNSFTTKGDKFKVKITGTTSSLEYGRIAFFAYPEGETKSYDGEGSIDKFSQNTQSDEFIVTASPGSYYLSVLAANMDSWNIQVSDYY